MEQILQSASLPFLLTLNITYYVDIKLSLTTQLCIYKYKAIFHFDLETNVYQWQCKHKRQGFIVCLFYHLILNTWNFSDIVIA